MARNKYLDWSGLSHYDVKIKEYITGKTNALDVRLTAAEGNITTLQSGKADKAKSLSGYGIADAYTKTEVDSKLAAKIQFKVVDSLPVSGETNVIYLVKSSTSVEGDVYDEYIWTNGKWEKIGSTKADLSGKVDKVASATTGNIALFSAGGNIQDAGKKIVTSVAAAESASDDNLPSEKAIRTELDKKANSASTLEGYGITDAYTKSEVDVLDGRVLASAKTYADEKIAALDASATGTGVYLKVGVVEEDGKITSVGIDESALQSKIEAMTASTKEVADNLDAHSGDTVRHITAAERTAWNAAEANAIASAKTYTDNQINALSAATVGAISEEETERKNADAALSGLVVAEETARKADKVTLSGLVVAEETARKDADAALSGLVVAEETERKADKVALSGLVVAEENARKADKVALSGLVVAEENARVSAINDLSAATVGAISAEESARISADAALQANIEAEAIARTTADAGLSARIDELEAISGQSHTHSNKEVLDGISAEKVAAWDAAEANARGYASAYTDTQVAALSGNVIAYADQKAADAEANAIASAKTYTDNQIAAAIDALDASVDNGDSQYVKITVAEVDGKLTGITVDQSRLESAIADAEANARGYASAYTDTKVAALSGNVIAYADQKAADAEANARGYASAYTDDKIAALDAAVTGTGTYLKVGVAEEDGKVTSVGIDETALKSEFEKVASAVTAEVEARKADKVALSGLVVAEENARKADKVALSGLVVAEENARKADKVALSGLVVAEENARKDADSALSSRIDALSGTSHSHDNKTVLDGISAEKVAAWDAAEANARGYASAYTDTKVAALSGNVIAYADQKALDAETNAKAYASAYTDNKINALDASVSGASNGFSVKVEQVDGKLSSIAVVGVDVDNKISTAIAGLDAEVSTSADADVAITIAEVDGKLTGVTASIVSIQNNEIDGLFVNL